MLYIVTALTSALTAAYLTYSIMQGEIADAWRTADEHNKRAMHWHLMYIKQTGAKLPQDPLRRVKL